MSQILTDEDQVTLSYMRQQKSNALMKNAVELIERLAQREGNMLNDALQTAARTLPDGYDIILTVENGAGCVELLGPDGEYLDFHDSTENLSISVSQALKFAITNSEE